MRRYPLDQIYEEVAFVAYHFNWGRTDILDMPHWERQRWCEEISDINEKMNDGESDTGGTDLRDLDL